MAGLMTETEMLADGRREGRRVADAAVDAIDEPQGASVSLPAGTLS